MNNPKSFFLSIILILFPIFILIISCEENERNEEANIQLVEYIYEEGVNKQDASLWNEVLTDEYVRHCESMPPELQEITGKEQMIGFLTDHFKAFPDWEETIDLIFADEDKVAYVTTGTGTFSGPMMDIQPTGKACNVKTMVIHRFEEGKIAESWVSWDNVHFMTQLGLFPPPAPSSEQMEEEQEG